MEWTPHERSANTYLAPDRGREDPPCRRAAIVNIYLHDDTAVGANRLPKWSDTGKHHGSTQYNNHWHSQRCLFTGSNFFVLEGSLRGSGLVVVTYARGGARHATNGRGRRRRLPNTKFEVFEGISGQTPVAKVMVFSWLLYATNMYLKRITHGIRSFFSSTLLCNDDLGPLI